jgi:nitrous oxide reductase
MPSQTQADQASEPVTAPERPSPMSRRSLLRGAAGAGAVGLAAAAGAGGVVALTRPRTQTAPPAAKPVAMADVPPNAMAGPLVVYLRDTTTGEMDVFAGTGQLRLHDPALFGQLLRAMH